jgi:hypothetical protein
MQDELLIQEIRGMRQDFRAVSEQVVRLSVQMESVAEKQAQHSNHAERLTVIETRMDAAEKQAKTYQWLVGVLVAAVLSLAGLIVPHLK